MDVSLFTLGFILGLKHALDADHLIAVSTIVSTKRNLLNSSLVGALWGFGHTIALLIVGLLVLALGIQIPERAAMGVEFCVGLMLVIMGVNVLRKLAGGSSIHMHSHRHGSFVHSHPHVHGEMDSGNRELPDHHRFRLQSIRSAILEGKASVAVGVVHGLAGSAGLMLLVAATIPSFWVGVFYILSFGVGSIGGMMVMSTLLGLPFILTAMRFRQMQVVVRILSGSASLAFGVFLCWEVGRVLWGSGGT